MAEKGTVREIKEWQAIELSPNFGDGRD
jgi:hypothetical protein